MPRNTLKRFPTAMLRRGLAQFHPGSRVTVQPPIDPPGNRPFEFSWAPQPLEPLDAAPPVLAIVPPADLAVSTPEVEAAPALALVA